MRSNHDQIRPLLLGDIHDGSCNIIIVRFLQHLVGGHADQPKSFIEGTLPDLLQLMTLLRIWSLLSVL